MTKKIYIAVSFLLLNVFIYGADFYEQGLDDYRNGRNDLAVQKFEKAMEADPMNDGACLYLGLLYQSKGDLSRAESTFKRGKEIQGLNYNDLIFNLANLYFNMKKYDESVSLYETLLQIPGKQRTASLLNLANLSVTTSAYQKAIDLYMDYLLEDPETGQRNEIEKMITLLRQTLDNEKAARLAEEEKVRKEQELAQAREEKEKIRLEEEAKQKQLAEAKRLEEEARQKALLNEILNSLSKSGNETKNITAESEKVVEEFETSGLDD
jgi:tetratricopeptide (TPR) repeat protein